MVKLLLDLPVERGVDPSSTDNHALEWASRNDHTSVVKLLLDLPVERGVDPSDNNNSALLWASKNSHVSVVKLLADSPKISLSDIPDLKVLDIIIKNYLKK